jgi:putative ABC transport system ATP-binding protein
MISVRDLNFAYEPDSFRLRVENLSIDAGQRVAWLGPSGSGKTTLLHLVAGILSTDHGCVETCGVNLTALGDAARRDFRITNVGLVFQEFELLDYLTVLDNILLAYRINRSLCLTSDIRDAAVKLSTEVGLADVLGRRPDQLSHGQRQRVAVCRALSTSPKLVLADEPTANLDADNKHRVLDVLDALVERAGATLVVVTHDHEVSQRFDHTIDISALAAHAPTQPGGIAHDA